jgi:hypothetical protein
VTVVSIGPPTHAHTMRSGGSSSSSRQCTTPSNASAGRGELVVDHRGEVVGHEPLGQRRRIGVRRPEAFPWVGTR